MFFLGCIFLCYFVAMGSADVRVPIKLRMGVVLTINTTVNSDYKNMEPAIGLAVDRARMEYGVRLELVLSLYGSGCHEVPALAATVRALNSSVDVLLGPGCTDDLIMASKMATVYRTVLVTGGGTQLDSTEAWPYVTRTAYNTNTQWSFFLVLCRQFNWSTVFVLYEVDSIRGSGGVSKKPSGLLM